MVIGSTNGTIFNGKYVSILYILRWAKVCLLVGLRLMFIAPLAKSEIIQFCWRFDSMMLSSFWHDDFNILFFFLSFIHSSFLLWETKIHFLLIGQWGAFESIMFKIGIEKRHHFSFFFNFHIVKWLILVFLNFIPNGYAQL